MDTTILLTVILILSVALLVATLPRLHRPRRKITKARPETFTYDTVVGRELGLKDRMTALRNLRPGTRLSWPEGDLSREVLRELLSLPESIDVLRWLEAERGAAVALLAIEQSLDMAGMMYGAQNRIVSGMLTSEQERQVHQSLQDKYGAMYGPLLRSDEDWGASKQRGDIVDGPSEHRHLVDALTRLRRKIGLPAETSPSRSQVDPGPDTLLADLLRLPDSTMATKTDAYPDVAIPPGEYLAEEIEARGISQKELAGRMGRPVNAINEIVNGKKAITAETALQLEAVMLEIPAKFWLNLETDYRLTRALIKRQA